MRMRALSLLLSTLPLAACGARSSLDLSGPFPAGDAADCGAPWVLFTWLTVEGDQGSEQIYARRADGSGGHVLTLPQPQTTYPSTTPDGTALLYADEGLSQLFLRRFADGTTRQLDTMGKVGFGSIAPNGQTVVYGDGNDLWVAGVDGPPAQHLLVPADSTPTGAAGYPVFLPDSQTVVFAVGGLVQSIKIDGTGLSTLLTDSDPIRFPNPALSPDGQQLAAMVSCDSGSTYDLRVYPLASLPAPCTAGVVVTSVPVAPPYYDLAWSPTGLIAYSGGHDVFLVSAAGGAPENLTADLTGPMATASEPTWAPGCTALP
jgi:Tol biopolymer transport system component